MGVRLSDPRPEFCSACHNSPTDLRFVDFDAAFDAGAFADRESQAYIAGSDDLHLCEACVRTAVEVLALRPQTHANQARRITELEALNEALRGHVLRLEGLISQRPDVTPPHRRPGRPAKVAA